MLYIDIVKVVALDVEYYEGIKVVPLVLLSNLFLGVYYALSLWYKLDDKTRFGAYMALIGSSITIFLNIWLIPVIGYMGSAIAMFICFFVMMVMSYLWGQKFYPIPYDLKSISIYTILALVLYFISTLFYSLPTPLKYGLNTLLFLSFVAVVYYKEKDKLKRLLNL
jgi:O-antigen/teichoic acid export membrane protein